MRSFATLPNLLTLARLILAPFVFVAIVSARHQTALVLFLVVAATDSLDGFLARRLRQETNIGAYLDPIADKLLLSGVYVSLAMARVIPVWVVVLILGRDLFLLLSSGIVLLVTAHREFRPSVWGKASTFVQIACATVFLLYDAVPGSVLLALARFLIWAVAAFTIWSGLHYGWRGFRWLKAH